MQRSTTSFLPPSYRVIAVAAALAVLSFSPFLLEGVNAETSDETTTESTVQTTELTLSTAGRLVEWKQLQLHITDHAVRNATALKLRSLSLDQQVAAAGTHRAKGLPSGFRSKSNVYRYYFSSKLRQPVVARFDYDIDPDNTERKVILYRASTSRKWKPLRTTLNRSNGYMQTVLPKHSGMLMIAHDKNHVEAPQRQPWFTAYPGTPHSDTAAVLDVKSGKFLYRQDAAKQRHIASITKLMTVAVFLATEPDLNEVVTFNAEYEEGGSTAAVDIGDQFTLSDAVYSALLPSANNMAKLLSYHAPTDDGKSFVKRMNEQAQTLQLGRTRFSDPTGLDFGNISTAGNIARFGRWIFLQYPELFLSAAGRPTYTIDLKNSDENVVVASTNKFPTNGKYRVLGFKTGYYPGSAERTLVIMVEEVSTGHQVVIALLGNPVYGSINEEAYALAEWAFYNWNFQNY